ncbi:hypothetical protein HHO41_15840 [Bacillus sp. DNRA2]|uniref:hypothetical protein n=1 Tax=Bacillus sp. DNRA2 TaxID=2723053 RepID=UPI00145E8DFB|nr:hypothetical protein [Bacillus sp. DNRA2]NMD71771.1 hypothetical protein [Bacillus sp. DNRA2]
MNVSGWIRAYMSKSMNNEEFLIKVANVIEKQLKEWDENYEVYIMKLTDYEFNVKKGETYLEVVLTEAELDELQKQAPFSLDVKIWKELERQGLEIIKGHGNYLDSIL